MPETPELAGARRILLQGVTGSGTSTLAAALSEALGIPWTDVDHLNWRPGCAEVVVALDYPRWLSFARLARRTARRVRTRERICHGNVETLRRSLGPDSILLWHWRAFARKRATTEALRAAPEGPPVLVLRRPRDADRSLASLRP